MALQRFFHCACCNPQNVTQQAGSSERRLRHTCNGRSRTVCRAARGNEAVKHDTIRCTLKFSPGPILCPTTTARETVSHLQVAGLREQQPLRERQRQQQACCWLSQSLCTSYQKLRRGIDCCADLQPAGLQRVVAMQTTDCSTVPAASAEAAAAAAPCAVTASTVTAGG